MRVLVTGGTGMLGEAMYRKAKKGNWYYASSGEYDLTSSEETRKMYYDIHPDVVIHLAARVGGVNGNYTRQADFFYENLHINMNVLKYAHINNVSKVISMLSTCIYPDNVTYPITEDQLHNGEPHFTNYGYAYAKRMLEVQSRTLRAQYGRKYISLVPSNMYGPEDNFDLEDGHFVAAVVRKICDAKRNKDPRVTFWGDGTPLRQFTYVDDMAEAIIWAIDGYDSPLPLNICNDIENSIAYAVETAADIVGYKGEIVWDTTKPIGQYKKTVSTHRLHVGAGYTKGFTRLREGLEKTCSWYQDNWPNLRGVGDET